MAVASYAVEILGSVSVKAGVTLQYSSVLSSFPTATVTIMKSQGVKVSINGSDMFDATFDAQNYLSGTGTAVFSKDCVIVVGKYRIVS